MVAGAPSGDPAHEAAEQSIMAMLGQHLDAIGALVKQFDAMHDGEQIDDATLAHVQNAHRCLGRALAAHVKSSTSYGQKDEPDGDEGDDAKRSISIKPFKAGATPMEKMLTRLDEMGKSIEALAVKRAEPGYQPVVPPETPLRSLEKAEDVHRAESSTDPEDKDPQPDTPEWRALPEAKRFAIADCRNTIRHKNAKA